MIPARTASAPSPARTRVLARDRLDREREEAALGPDLLRERTDAFRQVKVHLKAGYTDA